MPNDINPAAQAIAGAIGGAAFWGFIAIIVVAAIGFQAFKHRETQRTIREMVERGQTVDPQTVARLFEMNQPPPANPHGLLIGGLVMLCIGVGFALMGFFISLDHPEARNPMLGVACLIGMIGVPLLIASAVTGKRKGAPDQ